MVHKKGDDLKAIGMNKSRLITRSDVEISLRSSPERYGVVRQPRKPPRLVTPNTTIPNYMKSTRSSEARKEEIPKAKTLSKTSCFKRVGSLIKSPSFKHTGISTCSSTLKDSKFPRYLGLKPGASEAEGSSVVRVCSYNYCSLNGHHHKSAPPLKRFLCSRRRVIKSCKGKNFKGKIRGAKNRNDHDSFFVEIYVSGKEDAAQVSESLSDGPCSEIDFQYGLDQSKDTNFPNSVQNHSPFEAELEEGSCTGISLDELFCENSDLEWEEGQIYTANESDGQGIPGLETGKSFDEFLDEFPPYFHDEIVEFACFSDADSLPDSESTQTGEKDIKEPATIEDNEVSSLQDNEVAEESDSDQDLLDSFNKLKLGMRCKKSDKIVEDEKEFNPRGPNFLEIEPDPEAEKVDLKHQEIDKRRNAEEWMLDYALQKTVNKLAPAQRKKVALLVEAFEAVLPEPEHQSRRNSASFTHVKSTQACS